MRGLEHLPDNELPNVARMLAQGTLDPRDAEGLVRAARQQNPDLDAVTFLKDLNSAVQSARMAQDAHTRILAKQRSQVLQDVPEAAHGLFARMPDDDISTLRGLLGFSYVAFESLKLEGTLLVLFLGHGACLVVVLCKFVFQFVQ